MHVLTRLMLVCRTGIRSERPPADVLDLAADPRPHRLRPLQRQHAAFLRGDSTVGGQKPWITSEFAAALHAHRCGRSPSTPSSSPSPPAWRSSTTRNSKSANCCTPRRCGPANTSGESSWACCSLRGGPGASSAGDDVLQPHLPECQSRRNSRALRSGELPPAGAGLRPADRCFPGGDHLRGRRMDAPAGPGVCPAGGPVPGVRLLPLGMGTRPGSTRASTASSCCSIRRAFAG